MKVEIQEPRRENLLIDYEKLQKYVGALSYEQLKRSHKEWVEEYLGRGEKIRQEEWTRSIAVASRSFVEKVKVLLAFRAKGRDIIGGMKGINAGRDLLAKRLFSGPKTTI
jgi:putative transposase